MGKKSSGAGGPGHRDFQRDAKQGGNSLATCRRAVSRFQAEGNDIEAAKVLISMGWMYQGRERYPEAIDHFDRALQIYEKLDIGEWAANCHWYKGKTLRRLGAVR